MAQETECSECKRLAWEIPQPVVFVDGYGYPLCIFHAPAEGKRKELGSDLLLSPKEFNSLVMNRIDEVIDKRQGQCTLTGTVFAWGIRFFYYDNHPLPNILFDDAIFKSWVSFDNATFGGAATFRQAEFCGPAKFTGARFKWSGFDKAKFKDQADFTSVFFSSSATFTGVQTSRDGDIRMLYLGADSLGNVIFTRAELSSFTFRHCRWPELLGRSKLCTGNGIVDLVECEELYRAMKERAAKEHDQLMVSRWHALEKQNVLRLLQHGAAICSFSGLWRLLAESDGLSLHNCVALRYDRLCAQLRVKKLQSVIGRLLQGIDRLPNTLSPRCLSSATWWYSVCSGFGENPIRAMKVLAALVFAVLAQVGTVDLQNAAGAACASLPERLHAGLQHLLFVTSPQYSPAGAGWRMALLLLTRVLIPVQFGLFALAVRNRFRR